MDERERSACLEKPRADQKVSGVGSFGIFEPSKSRRLEQVALLEHGQRSSQPARMSGQPTKSKLNRAADRSPADSLDVARSFRGRSDPTFAHCLDELVHQERHSSRRTQAGTDKDPIRNGAQPRLHKPGYRCSRQRSGADHFSGRIGHHRREQPSVGAHLARARGQDECNVQLFESRQQEGQVAQRGSICPMRVVDDDAKRIRGGEVRTQPVEAVEDREGRIEVRRRRALRSGSPQEIEQIRPRAGG